MIIFGTTGIKRTIDKGDFACPQCDAQKEYRHRKVMKFFTLYFIPLIPLGSAGEYVECRTCKGTFIPRVLEMTPASNTNFEAIYEMAIRHSMVQIMLADGVIDDNEKVTVLEIINNFSHNNITMADLELYIKEVQLENEDISVYLKKVGPTLNEHGKETLIKCALQVAAADGHIDRSELDQITIMSRALEMSQAHFKGILVEMQKDNSSISLN